MSRSFSVVAVALAFAVLSGCRGVADEPDEASGVEQAEPETEVDVQVDTIKRTTLHAYLDAFGTVVAEPASDGHPAGAAQLAAPAAGVVVAVPIAEGQRVRAGQLVVQMDDRIARADVTRAKSQVAFAEQTLAREAALLEQHNTSQQQYEAARETLSLARAELARAEGSLALVQLRSPLDGVVASVHARPGQSVDLHTVMAEVVDLQRLVVEARVPAELSASVTQGQTAEVSAQGRTCSATVSYVHPRVDPATGSVAVRLAPASGATLLPGALARVRIQVDERRDRLAVPRSSVFIGQEGRGTLSIVRDDIARAQEVRVGLEDRGLIEVDGPGLAAGMTVVTVGAYALPEQTRVHVARDGE